MDLVFLKYPSLLCFYKRILHMLLLWPCLPNCLCVQVSRFQIQRSLTQPGWLRAYPFCLYLSLLLLSLQHWTKSFWWEGTCLIFLYPRMVARNLEHCKSWINKWRITLWHLVNSRKLGCLTNSCIGGNWLYLSQLDSLLSWDHWAKWNDGLSLSSSLVFSNAYAELIVDWLWNLTICELSYLIRPFS